MKFQVGLIKLEDLLDNPDTTLLPVNVNDVVGEGNQNRGWTNSDELVLLTDTQGLGFSDSFVEDDIGGIYDITNFSGLIHKAG